MNPTRRFAGLTAALLSATLIDACHKKAPDQPAPAVAPAAGPPTVPPRRPPPRVMQRPLPQRFAPH